ncbi:MFS transporter [Rhizobium sp. CG5]|uniref:MFS transporter n=1 Tax=Rhizobium sp. CG5 TaxID=2726076 RepID=UPI00203344BA|nr:MFS transporter [Rhizobium sp. CG5]MCM2477287.1 MFS transporter [Rhizobium sp. CG5]
MSGIFGNRTFVLLFGGQTLGLLGNGITIVGLAYFAFTLAGDQASALIGLFYILKMLAFITIAPLSAGFGQKTDRRLLLIGLCLFRAVVVSFLPFSDSVWQATILVFLMHAATAAFVPLMQAVTSDVFPEEEEFTRAVGMTRLSYSMEQLVSPMIAGLLLMTVSPSSLFFFTIGGFVIAALILSGALVPKRSVDQVKTAPWRAALDGIRIYLATPRLRGLVFADLAVAIAAATIFLNTVVLVQGKFGLSERYTAIAYAAFGIGAATSSIVSPRLLGRIADRTAILGASAIMAALTFAESITQGLAALLPLWLVMGAGYSLSLIAASRIVRRSASYDGLPRLFATQVMQSHLCWLAGYALVGGLTALLGVSLAAAALGAISLLAFMLAVVLWPADDPEVLEHSHADLPPDHPHLASGISVSAYRHSHRFVIDDLHTSWPKASD